MARAAVCAAIAATTAAASSSFLADTARRHVGIAPHGHAAAEAAPVAAGTNAPPATAALESASSEGAGRKLGAMKAATPWFHTSDELVAEARDVASRCGGRASVESHTNGEVTIDSVRVKADKPDATNRVFITFGEHSRELISPESGLAFLKALCGEAQGSKKVSPQSLLQDNDFTLVLNANPRSRRKVEQGNFCLRVNPNGVDLNRNYPTGWTKASPRDLDNTNPGPHPGSEPETQIMKKLMDTAKPTSFLTVHSGTRGMYMPWAYSPDKLETKNGKPMMEVLEALDKEHCRCPYGAAGKEVGYAAPGTSLDYARSIPENEFSFAFEIACDKGLDEALKKRFDEEVEEEKKAAAAALLQTAAAATGALRESRPVEHPEAVAFLEQHHSDFVRVGAEARAGETEGESLEGCFEQYNPVSEKEYRETIDNWVATYMEMAQLTNEKLHEIRRA